MNCNVGGVNCERYSIRRMIKLLRKAMAGEAVEQRPVVCFFSLLYRRSDFKWYFFSCNICFFFTPFSIHQLFFVNYLMSLYKKKNIGKWCLV